MTSSPNFASKRRIHATKNGRLVGYRIVESPNDDEPASTCSPTVTTRLSYETTAESLTSAITSANGEKASTSAATTPSYEKKATTLNEKRKSAVLIFHPMGASAHVVDFFAPTWLKKVDSSHVLLSVDRPGAGDTSWETPPLNNAVGSFAAKAEKRRSSFEDNLKYDFSSGSTTVYGHLVRHAEDCLSVLLAEKVTEVKVIAICLGHAYMTYFLLFLQSQRSRKSPGRQLTEATLMPRVTDVTLLAPFVSAACADTLRQARWASYLPSPVLHVGTSLLGGLQRSVIPIAFGAFGGEFLFRCLFWRKERERFTCSSENSTLSTSTTAAKKLPGPGTVLEAMQLASRRCMGTEMKVGADRGWHRGCEELADVLAESRDESKNSKPSEKKPSPEDEKNSSSISSTCDEQKQSSRWEKKEDWCSASTCCSTHDTTTFLLAPDLQ
ncbi:unnamed protein product [Amoebophrya sp. A25]|nr:unnamed protein product [Amoebophrya sp. A25]|eukprot:GSA25T00022213001.1